MSVQVERRERRWCFLDLVVDHRSGKLRETAVWSNVGKAAMTVAFLWVVYRGGSSEWLWLTYGGVVVFHETAARVMNRKDREQDASKPQSLP